VTMGALAALLVSILCLGALGLGDPKRRRTGRLPGTGQPPVVRRALVAAALVPGIALAAAGDAAAFFVWMGGCAVAGWTVAQGLSRSSGRARR